MKQKYFANFIMNKIITLKNGKIYKQVFVTATVSPRRNWALWRKMEEISRENVDKNRVSKLHSTKNESFHSP